MKLILVLASVCLVASDNMGGPHNNTQVRNPRHLDSSSSSSSSSSDSDENRGRAQKIDVINPVVVVEQSPAAPSSQYKQKRSVAPNATQIRPRRQIIVPVPVDSSSDSDSDEVDSVAVVNPPVVVAQDPTPCNRQKRAAPANATQPRPRRHLSSSSSDSSDSDEFRGPQVIDVVNPVVTVEQIPAASPVIGQGACPNQMRSRRQVIVPAPLSPVVPIDDSSDSDSDEIDVVNPVVVVEQNPALAVIQ